MSVEYTYGVFFLSIFSNEIFKEFTSKHELHPVVLWS